MKDANKLSEKIFKDGMAKLEILFNRELKPEALVIYYEKLSHFEDYDFNRTVEQIIETEHFFPSIAKFLEFKPRGQPVALTDEMIRKLNE
jgi:hypothetical protein